MSEEPLGKELLTLAIEIEKNGRSFYDSLARNMNQKEAKIVFKDLSEREKEHEKSFREMLGRAEKYETLPIPPETRKYIRDVASSSIFTSDKADAWLRKKSWTDIEALEKGMELEKDSILFYNEMEGMLPREERGVLEMIVDEEKKHLGALNHLASVLNLRAE